MWDILKVNQLSHFKMSMLFKKKKKDMGTVLDKRDLREITIKIQLCRL